MVFDQSERALYTNYYKKCIFLLVVENLNGISELTPCSERLSIAREAVETLQTVYNSMDNNVKSAEAYLEAMENYVRS